MFGRVELTITRDPNMKEGTLKDEMVKGSRWSGMNMGPISSTRPTFSCWTSWERWTVSIDSYALDLRGRPELCAMVAEAFHKRDLGRMKPHQAEV